MVGRDRTCDAPRFRRALYRIELRPRGDGRGWNRTSDLLFVRQALGLSELLARRTDGRELESNQQPPVCQEGALPS